MSPGFKFFLQSEAQTQAASPRRPNELNTAVIDKPALLKWDRKRETQRRMNRDRNRRSQRAWNHMTVSFCFFLLSVGKSHSDGLVCIRQTWQLYKIIINMWKGGESEAAWEVTSFSFFSLSCLPLNFKFSTVGFNTYWIVIRLTTSRTSAVLLLLTLPAERCFHKFCQLSKTLPARHCRGQRWGRKMWNCMRHPILLRCDLVRTSVWSFSDTLC